MKFRDIVELVGRIAMQQATIATALEQQSAASTEMSESINSVATSSQSVAGAVERLRETSADVATNAHEVASPV